MSKAAIFLLVLCIGHALAVDDVIVKNLKIYSNCEEFFIKAFCYAPSPLGASNAAANNEGGLCGWRLNYQGINQSACTDEDYFDGSAGGNPAVLPNGWFRDLWTRDLPVMKQMGANTVRIYHTSPWTKAYTEANVGTNGVVYPYGKSHREFLDVAAANDLKVIYPLPGEYDWLMNYSEQQMQQLLMNVIDEVGNHSAILMFALGNELPLDDNLIGILNKYIAFSKNYMKTKWNRSVPITHAVVDLPTSYNHLAKALDVDVFSSNAGYRGLGFQDLWTGNPGINFTGWKNLSATYNKPLFISEVGWMSANNEINSAIPDWFNQKLADLFNYVDDGCVGYAFFEFNDETVKADPLQQTMGVVGSNATIVNGKSSIDAGVYIADTIYPKPILYNAVVNGTFNGKPFNMGTSTWTILGRPADVLPAAECATTPSSTTGSNSTTGTQSATTGTQSSTTGNAPSSTSSTTGNVPSSTTGNPQQDNHVESSGVKVFASAIAVVALAYFL